MLFCLIFFIQVRLGLPIVFIISLAIILTLFLIDAPIDLN